jgi:hypothetical protein
MNMPKESIHLNPHPSTPAADQNQDRPGEGGLLRVVNPATEESGRRVRRRPPASRPGRDGREERVR